ncbi:alpha-L-rhamnosidase C-terminal domain-containing protein [Occallatibacter savannae]|uniref:alpha-L-rhamnosidase-related protein n=1 Tax=Occallatibacter savannae TaxID=1002691 RepID=UPI000D69E99E|nr:alpha-L-rhamnosidase C-terminal domain-containing protein [Occallatibacter savannae]
MRPIALLLALTFAPTLAFGQTSTAAPVLQPDPVHRSWHAAWVTHPTAPLREPIVLHFKRAVDLGSKPTTYVVRVSADNRFILYVNGSRVGDGPARGDLMHWRYERFDIAPLLKSGPNLITATVWNFGVYAPLAQFSDRTAFLLESEAKDATGISTPRDWLVEEEAGVHPLGRDKVTLQTYFASGPGEELDASKYDWEWSSGEGKNWVPVGSPMRDSIFPTNGAHSADTTGDNPWGMIPDELPKMEYGPTEVGATVRNSGKEQPGVPQFPGQSAQLPANGHFNITIDRKTLTTAYPELIVSGGKGAHIVLTYSEALYDDKRHKGDRDAADYTDSSGVRHPRKALGLTDSFLPDGGQHRTFMPLWWRTWRYLDLDITTGSEPLTLDSLKAYFTAYPFEERAKFDSGQADLDKIWEVSWRTARLDAHETYMDTPYYEQLQYIGDTRIQALISYSVAGDDRLGRQALQAFDQSRIPEGITRSRYPSSLPQNIPTFSLIWVGMLHDYWMYRPDPQIVRDSLPGTRDVLTWFAKYEHTDGLLGELPWWSFIDWVVKGEIPSYDANHESCMTSLQYLGALIDAADLEKNLGDPVLAQRYQARLSHVRSGIASMCWVPSRGLLAENPEQKVFSQQANILGVLYDVIPKEKQQDVLRRLMSIQPGTTPDGVMSASYYFRFYLSRALDHAGLGEEYLNSLDPWRELLPMHFSTWPEQPGETRSDSHAWSAHPIYDLLTLVAGVEPASEGFASVRIAPHLGSLEHLNATYPHPQGNIQMVYRRTGSGLDATVTLPGILTGTFQYGGRSWELKPGANHIEAR